MNLSIYVTLPAKSSPKRKGRNYDNKSIRTMFKFKKPNIDFSGELRFGGLISLKYPFKGKNVTS